jgi:hypothetical protein
MLAKEKLGVLDNLVSDLKYTAQKQDEMPSVQWHREVRKIGQTFKAFGQALRLDAMDEIHRTQPTKKNRSKKVKVVDNSTN